MRRTLFWLGWAILVVLPIVFGIEIFRLQDLPPIQAWKWAILGAAVLLIIVSRNRDDVLKHHVA